MTKRPDADTTPTSGNRNDPKVPRALEQENLVWRSFPWAKWLQREAARIEDGLEAAGFTASFAISHSIVAPWVGSPEGDRIHTSAVIVPPTTNPDRPTPLDGKVAFKVEVVDYGEGTTTLGRYPGEPPILVAHERESDGDGEGVIHHA